MDLNEAHYLARDLMDDHGLDFWIFKFDRAKRRFGAAEFRSQTITMSAILTELNDEEQVRDTILHEIAHALAGHAAGHGPAWRATARRIGANPNRIAQNAVTAPRRYRGTCPSCGSVTSRDRMTEKAKRIACSKCCNTHNSGRWSAEYMYAWVDTNLARV